MKTFTIEANKKNGNKEVIKVYGDTQAIAQYIETYQGDDLGNDIICDLWDSIEIEFTGVEIEVKPTFEQVQKAKALLDSDLSEDSLEYFHSMAIEKGVYMFCIEHLNGSQRFESIKSFI